MGKQMLKLLQRPSNHEVFLIITQSLETLPSYPQHHKHNTAGQLELREEFFGKVSSHLNTKVLAQNLALRPMSSRWIKIHSIPTVEIASEMYPFCLSGARVTVT